MKLLGKQFNLLETQTNIDREAKKKGLTICFQENLSVVIVKNLWLALHLLTVGVLFTNITLAYLKEEKSIIVKHYPFTERF